MKIIINISLVLIMSLGFISCDDFLEIEPEGKVIPKTLEENRALITTAYNAFPVHKSYAAFRSDELILDSSTDDAPFFKDFYLWNDTNPDPITFEYPWLSFYTTVFYANHIINEGVSTIKQSEEKDQLIGEAYALRAFVYFDLVNLYGKPYNVTTSSQDKGVPIVLITDLEQVLSPSSVATVYEQVVADIERAKELINVNTQEVGKNYRFSKSALYTLEARVNLYMKNWDNALQSANKALTYNETLVDFNVDSTLPNQYNSSESILALEDVFGYKMNNASFISNDLIASYDRGNDLRFDLYFVENGTNYKARKGGTQDFICSMRTSELYLIKAEALLNLNQLDASKTALLSLLKNRYTTAYFTTLNTEIQSMDEAEYTQRLFEERRRELALEGHRWFDLRRNNQKEITHTYDGTVYTLEQNDPRYTLQYPRSAKLNNPNL
ncbi:SusD-like starch-binding protein associating with outer membrane [Tenacibaculum adriaticum]|uniref:SusD-like starch-binding protein associating with outer membrane n=1 Tax=Tenacibaculum adriaticum TaxID=413713 RepID=A0A5S5DYC7_9FLAO|nr:RagB/SusD family nutrient uptake outer membrane protein [Tenacibaculum adriaticum]TYP99599.1 SusD-like starch-binding protein associating with outer membrane [Tenacibaculum adriaticum]